MPAAAMSQPLHLHTGVLSLSSLAASQSANFSGSALQVLPWSQGSALEHAVGAPSQQAARLPAARCARRSARQDRLQAHMRPWTAALFSLPAPPLARPARLPVLTRVACVQLGSVMLYLPAFEHTCAGRAAGGRGRCVAGECGRLCAGDRAKRHSVLRHARGHRQGARQGQPHQVCSP